MRIKQAFLGASRTLVIRIEQATPIACITSVASDSIVDAGDEKILKRGSMVGDLPLP